MTSVSHAEADHPQVTTSRPSNDTLQDRGPGGAGIHRSTAECCSAAVTLWHLATLVACESPAELRRDDATLKPGRHAQEIQQLGHSPAECARGHVEPAAGRGVRHTQQQLLHDGAQMSGQPKSRRVMVEMVRRSPSNVLIAHIACYSRKRVLFCSRRALSMGVPDSSTRGPHHPFAG
jgi:hypothetical protein